MNPCSELKAEQATGQNGRLWSVIIEGSKSVDSLQVAKDLMRTGWFVHSCDPLDPLFRASSSSRFPVMVSV